MAVKLTDAVKKKIDDAFAELGPDAQMKDIAEKAGVKAWQSVRKHLVDTNKIAKRERKKKAAKGSNPSDVTLGKIWVLIDKYAEQIHKERLRDLVK